MAEPARQPSDNVFHGPTASAQLEQDVRALAQEIGERHVERHGALALAEAYLLTSFREAGLQVRRQDYVVAGKRCANIEGTIPGGAKQDQILIVGAHYDSVKGSPGANDNASGIACLLALARVLGRHPHEKTVRLVAFVNEEPPFLHTQRMGSVLYAQECGQRREDIWGMFSLETLGYYPDLDASDEDEGLVGRLLRRRRGNFLAFVSNLPSRSLVREALHCFRLATDFPARQFTLPGFLKGVKSSDHWAFWRQGYRAVMLTDTAPFRYPFYHRPTDTPDKLSYAALAEVTNGLTYAVRCLANGDET